MGRAMPCQRRCGVGLCQQAGRMNDRRRWVWAMRRVELLTNREREIFMLLGEELANGCIAVTLCITERTVKEHMRNVLDKLGLDSKTEAAIISVLYRERLYLGTVDVNAGAADNEVRAG